MADSDSKSAAFRYVKKEQLKDSVGKYLWYPLTREEVHDDFKYLGRINKIIRGEDGVLEIDYVGRLWIVDTDRHYSVGPDSLRVYIPGAIIRRPMPDVGEEAYEEEGD